MRAPAELLPHAAPMILIDEIVASDESSLTARVTIGPASPFADSDGVASHIGLEYMAQACAAWVGIIARAAGKAPRIGYLLGTRNFVARTARFAHGDALDIEVACVFRDVEMAAFDCRIRRGNALIAQAQLSVYQPSAGRDG